MPGEMKAMIDSARRGRGGFRAALAGLGLFCPWALAADLPAPAGLPGLGSVAEFPGAVTGAFENLMATGGGSDFVPGTFASPSLGAVSTGGARSRLDQLLKIRGAVDSLAIPEAFSVVMWVRLPPGQKSTMLFGLGDPQGDYLVAATDAKGAPSLAFLNPDQPSQVDRAKMAPADLGDARLHAVVAVVNLGSGLVRLYIDGRPEAASTVSLWRPRRLGFAFASYLLQGHHDGPGGDGVGLLMPRIVTRELTEEEVGKIKPAAGPEEDVAAIDAEVARLLARDTLVEFWPSQYHYLLRRRPLSGGDGG